MNFQSCFMYNVHPFQNRAITRDLAYLPTIKSRKKSRVNSVEQGKGPQQKCPECFFLTPNGSEIVKLCYLRC